MARDYIEKKYKKMWRALTHPPTNDTKKFMLGAKDSKWSQKSE